MRNRLGSSVGVNGGDTLSRLNEALNVLENRLGSPNEPLRQRESVSTDLSAIRARQSSLDAEARRGEELRHEMRYLREQIERNAAPDHSQDFESLRQELRSMARAQQQSGSRGEADVLREEIAELKLQVTALAREETMQELMDRWGVLERELASLPNTMASREDLAAMAERLDGIHESMQTLPRGEAFFAMEEQVHALATAIERLATLQAAPSDSNLEVLEQRLDDLTRAIASVHASVEATPGLDAIERIEARISGLSRQLDEREAAAPAHDFEHSFSELAGRIDHVSTLMQDMGSSKDNQTDPQLFEEMNRRLDAIALKFETASSQPDPEVAALFGSIDSRMAELAERIAENERNAAEIPSIAALENRLEDIAAMLSNSMQANADTNNLEILESQITHLANTVSAGATMTVDDKVLMATARAAVDEAMARFSAESTPNAGPDLTILRDLEAQIATLSDRLSTPAAPAPLIDEQSLFAAARAAAEEAVSRVAPGSDAQDAAALTALGDDLRALEELARESDSRNTRTFEAIHDTLLKVVDHLSGLEESVRKPLPSMPEAEAFMPKAAPVQAEKPVPVVTEPPRESADEDMADRAMAARVSLDEVPPMSYENDYVVTDTMDDEDHKPIFEIEQKRGSLSPAQAAAAAAMAAVQSGKSPSARPGPAGEKKAEAGGSILKSMSQKLRRGSAKPDAPAQNGPAHLNTDTLELNDEDTIRPLEIDEEPIDPGAGGSDLSEIMRRVREERAVGDPKSPSVGAAMADSGKSDFIAAARRAAQAAAADATVLAGSEKESKKSSTSSLGAILAKRRKPLLIGAGAILLALLALPLLRGYLSPEVPQTAAIVEQDVGIGETETASIDSTAEENEFLVADENTGASVDETAEVAMAEDRAAEPGMEAVPELTEEIPTNAEPVAATVTLADIPDEVGPLPLREAAASGDAKALYVIGDYYTGGVPGQSANDLAEAFKWYQRSADLGYAPAQYRTGNFYEKGFGVEKDIEQAKTFYQLAAEQGNASAMHNLAVLFASGVDGTPDMDSAARWFQKAAELGVKDSQFNLGILSAQGKGLPQDLVESYKWFAIAAMGGDKDAEGKRDEVASALRPDQLETARGATELWKQKEADEEVNFVDVPDEWMKDPAATSSTPPQLTAGDMKKAVSNIQAILNANGYDAGPVDGMMGGKTREAIKAFQAANGMAATGDVNPELVGKLLELAKKKS